MTIGTYDWVDIETVVDREGLLDIVPGELVTHAQDRNARGICVSRSAPDGAQPQITVLWSREPKLLTLPPIKKIRPSLFAKSIVSRQPMSMPKGNIFYQDFSYKIDDDKK